MFSAFHHLDLSQARAPLADAVAHGEGIAVFEMIRQRSVLMLLAVLPPSVALDYWGRLRRRSHSPRAERIKVKPPSPPSAQSVQTKKKPPGDLAISP